MRPEFSGSMVSHIPKMPINFQAPNRIRKVLAKFGRTEDIKFSPDNKRLAISGFGRNRILLLDVEIAVSSNGIEVLLKDYAELSSESFHEPHGISFLDDENLIVANRSGLVTILKLPSRGTKEKGFMVTPLRVLKGGVYTPGSVTVSRTDGGEQEVLVCNNLVHYVSRHILDSSSSYEIRSNEALLAKGLNIPDGVAVSHDGQWIAISNHNMHNVFLYRNHLSLDLESDPDAVLNGIEYPHGLCFTRDGSYILVADAGAPCVRVYAKGNDDWNGVRNPSLSIRVMEDEVYLRGRKNPQEGGPKGIDIDRDMNVLVTTCEQQILAFFDLQSVLKAAASTKAQAPSELAGLSAT